MKKIIMFFFILLCFFSVKNVNAQDQYKLTLYKQDGIYFSRKGGVVNDSYPYYIYRFGDIYAYCIQPGKHFTTYTYVGKDDFVDLGFSKELKEELELIGYYGRDYPGHNNIRYSMATQALIWEKTGVEKVSFWTGQNETGNEIDISNERNEILRLVERHKVKPDLPHTIYGFVQRKMVIKDKNGVLNDYEVIGGGGQDVWIENNELHILPRIKNLDNIILRRKKYDDLKTIIFVGKDASNSQILGRLRLSSEDEISIGLSIDGVRILLHKVDSNGNKINIENIKFKIKNLDTNEYLCEFDNCMYYTDLVGEVLTNNLYYGEYEIEEVEDQIISGYTWNNKKIKVDIFEDSDIKWRDDYYAFVEVTFPNQKVVGNLEIYKTGEEAIFSNNQITYQKNKLKNIEFDLYNDKNEFIKTIKTDNNGYAKYENLSVGKYYIVEKSKLANYVENNEKYYFEIKQNNQYDEVIVTKLDIANILKKGNLELLKIDLDDNHGIVNTVFEIYDINNHLLFTKKTNEQGKIIIDNLPIGKYYVIEKQANELYQNNNKKVYFEIVDNQETVKLKITNEKITGSVKIIKNGEKYYFKDNEVTYVKTKLNDIEFSLHDINGNFIDKKVTSDGIITFDNLPLGKYYIMEKMNNNTYIVDNNKYYFEIKKEGNNGSIEQITINNFLKKGNLEIIKVDLDDNRAIPNTIISLYNMDNQLLLTRKTDENGRIIINKLPVGKYYLKEDKANDLYIKSNERKFFEISNNLEKIEIKMTNKKITGRIEIFKKGEDCEIINNELLYKFIELKNIEFTLFNLNGEIINKGLTNENGYLVFNNIPLGKYYLEETSFNDFYLRDNKKYYLEIKKDDLNEAIDVKLEINNYLKKGDLLFSKEDFVTGEGISGTIVEIYNKNDELLFTRETNENGEITINKLPIGEYYIIEKEANSLYQITNERVYFIIKENGEIVKAKMLNEKKEILVPKTQSDETKIINSFFGISIIFILGRYYYERKETI